LTVKDSTVADNHASLGGAIYTESSELTVERSSIARNDALEGGGIYETGNSSSATRVVDSAITNNTAYAPTFGGVGGGGLNLRSSGAVVIQNVTISGNAGYDGGGILTSAASVRVFNSTITGNDANGTFKYRPGQGGGCSPTAARIVSASSRPSSPATGADRRNFAPHHSACRWSSGTVKGR